MLGADAKEDDRMFKMSLDAIDPRKGHVSGNLRWVCSFLNSINQDKAKQIEVDNGWSTVTSWTKEIFNEYIGSETNH